MKAVVTLLPLAALAAGFTYPDEHIFSQLPLEDTDAFEGEAKGFLGKLPGLDKWTGRLGRLKKPFKHVPASAGHPLDHALSKVKHECKHADKIESSPFDYSWIEDELQRLQEVGEVGEDGEVIDEEDERSAHTTWGWPRLPGRKGKHLPHRGKKGAPHRLPHHGPPHHGPPHHGPPHHKPKFPQHRPGKGRHGRPPHKKPHHRPGWKWHHHPHKHHKPNQTIYELISESKFTKNVTALIDKNKDIVKLLNSTDANHTIFVPTDWAFKRIHKHLDKIPDEIVTKVLLYHILPDLYPSFKLLWTHTAPTLLEGSKLGGHPQRVLSTFSFFGGLRANYFSKVIAANIGATNGIIHATSKIILPPPPALAIVTHLPGTFSTFELGLRKTGLYDKLNTTGKDTVGGTLFAPTNLAFKKLGPAANAFLFGKFGEKYLKALLSYHVVPGRTLYSTAFYDGEKDSMQEFFTKETPQKHQDWTMAIKGVKTHKGAKTAAYVHLDLPTLLDDRPIAIDIVRRGFFVTIKANAFVRVAVKDGLAKDGVVQVLNSILIPPKKPSKDSAEEVAEWDGESEMKVEELKARLEPYLVKQDLAEEEQDGMKLDL